MSADLLLLVVVVVIVEQLNSEIVRLALEVLVVPKRAARSFEARPLYRFRLLDSSQPRRTHLLIALSSSCSRFAFSSVARIWW